MKSVLKVFIVLYLFIGCTTPIKKNDTNIIYITLPSKVINNYKAMPVALLWKDIGISQLRENKKLYFKINYVRDTSILDELGFKKNDIIYNINDETMYSFADYMELFLMYNGKDNIKVGIFRK